MFTRQVEVSLQNFPQDSSLQIVPSQVNVSFWVQDRYIDLIQDYDFEVYANLFNLNEDDSTIVPEFESYPDYARDITISPIKVSVKNAK